MSYATLRQTLTAKCGCLFFVSVWGLGIWREKVFRPAVPRTKSVAVQLEEKCFPIIAL